MLQVTICAYDAPDAVGGPLTWLLRLAPALKNHGMRVNVLFLTWGEERLQIFKALKEMGISCTALSFPPTTEDRIRWISEQVGDSLPDVFVSNLVTPAWFAARWLRRAGVPSVGVLHSDDAFYRGLQEVFVFGQGGFRISDLVCVSRELECSVSKRGPETTRVHRIPYGVPVPEGRVERSNGILRLAFVGRLAEEQKQVSEVTRSLCRATREIPGTTAVLYGDGPDREKVEAILATEGSGLPVRMGGRIASGQIQGKLLECDVLVLLSDYEGLPIAVMEAMACGCVPVCLSIRRGIPELVEDGVTGLLVDDRGAGFVAAIRCLHEEPGLWLRLSTAARERITEEYSDSVCHERWAELLKSVATRGAKKRPIHLPRRLHLPPIHPALASEDVRVQVVSLPVRLYHRSRKFIGKLRRCLCGHPCIRLI